MKKREFGLLICIFLLASCSSSKKDLDYIREVSYYCGDVRMDKNLSISTYDGLLAHGANNEEMGKFEYHEHFNRDENELVWVDYTYVTNFVLKENFFFKNGELIYAESFDAENPKNKKSIYIKLNRIIYESKSDFEMSHDLMARGTKFLTDFKASR